MTLQRFFGRFTIGTDSQDFTIDTTPSTGPFAVQLTANDYFLEAYTGEGVDQLVEHMEAQIQAADAAFGAAAVSYDAATDRVSINLATAGTVTWDDTDLRDLLGYTGNLSGGSAYPAPQSPRYVWSPSKAPARYPLDLTQFWAPRSTTRVGRSKDGTSHSLPGPVLYDAELGYELLKDEGVITPASGTIYEDLQQFWTDVVHAGQPIRVYVDRDISSAANTKTGLWTPDDEGEPIGSFLQHVGRHLRNYNGLWDVDCRLEKLVE